MAKLLFQFGRIIIKSYCNNGILNVVPCYIIFSKIISYYLIEHNLFGARLIHNEIKNTHIV